MRSSDSCASWVRILSKPISSATLPLNLMGLGLGGGGWWLKTIWTSGSVKVGEEGGSEAYLDFRACVNERVGSGVRVGRMKDAHVGEWWRPMRC